MGGECAGYELCFCMFRSIHFLFPSRFASVSRSVVRCCGVQKSCWPRGEDESQIDGKWERGAIGGEGNKPTNWILALHWVWI